MVSLSNVSFYKGLERCSGAGSFQSCSRPTVQASVLQEGFLRHPKYRSNPNCAELTAQMLA